MSLLETKLTWKQSELEKKERQPIGGVKVMPGRWAVSKGEMCRFAAPIIAPEGEIEKENKGGGGGGERVEKE